MRRAVQGAPLVIPAVDYNKFIDTTEAFAQSRKNVQSSTTATKKTYESITIKNSTGYDLGKGDPVGLGDSLLLPEDNENEYNSRIVIDGVIADHELHAGRFAVCVDAIPVDGFGAALLTGVVQVWLTVDADSAEHSYCDLIATTGSGAEDVLAPVPFGTSRILWKEDGTGEDINAIIQLHCQQIPALMCANADEDAGTITAKVIDSAGAISGKEFEFVVVEYVSGS
jgi:hypothetical protein